MKLSVNQRIIFGFIFLIVSYGVIGYVILKNVDESRELTLRNSQVNQPTLLRVSELNLIMVNSRSFISSWIHQDISDHQDKIALKKLHSDQYPSKKLELLELSKHWGETQSDSLRSILSLYEDVLSKQQSMMDNLNSIEAYQDFLLRVQVEATLEEAQSETQKVLTKLAMLRTELQSAVDIEEQKMLESFDSIRTANIGLTALAIVIGLIVAGITIRSVRLQEQKEAITAERDEVQEQKLIIEEKNREITASINYASRIQGSILPAHERLKAAFNEHMVFYRPRDIVSGDFYWFHEIENSKEVLIAAADSTGHGVPGAFVSLVCHNSLNAAVEVHHIDQPAKVLDKASEMVETAFTQTDNVRDGMDIALCKLNREEMKLEFAGANNPLYLFRNGEMIETKGSRQHVGYMEDREPFTHHSVDLQPNDRFYIFSDGFVDQFGGPKQKKYKHKQFVELLKSYANVPMAEQEARLEKELNDWMGDIQQIDDVLVIGIEV